MKRFKVEYHPKRKSQQKRQIWSKVQVLDNGLDHGFEIRWWPRGNFSFYATKRFGLYEGVLFMINRNRTPHGYSTYKRDDMHGVCFEFEYPPKKRFVKI